MSGKLVTTLSTVACFHQGTVNLQTSNSKVFVEGSPVLLESDIQQSIIGCLFYRGDSYSPCVKITWKSGATKVQVDGTNVLLDTNIGDCFNPSNLLQGTAQFQVVQRKVTGI